MTTQPEAELAERIAAFSQARRLVDQQAPGRFKRASEAQPKTKEEEEALRTAYMDQPLLLSPVLRSIATEWLAKALGRDAEAIDIMTWPSLEKSYEGTPRTLEWSEFAQWHEHLATQIAPKRMGLVYSPTTATDGHRASSSVVQVNALALDVDGTGDWEHVLQLLTDLGLAFVAHRTGGHRTGLPKWRLILPLHEPYSTSTQTAREAWKAAYSSCRVVFGSIARLRGWGFDPATGGPSHPWFPGFRRGVEAEPREVRWAYGATLNLQLLLAGVPPLTEPSSASYSGGAGASGLGPSLLELAFDQAGMLGQDLGAGRRAVFCPWEGLHSKPLPPGASPTSSTVIFEGNSQANLGSFYCLHASCGRKLAAEVLEELPPEAVIVARALHRRGDSSVLPADPNYLPGLPSPPRSGRF